MNKKEDEDIMLDTSYYEKADEIIARHTREERSLIPIIRRSTDTCHRNF